MTAEKPKTSGHRNVRTANRPKTGPYRGENETKAGRKRRFLPHGHEDRTHDRPRPKKSPTNKESK